MRQPLSRRSVLAGLGCAVSCAALPAWAAETKLAFTAAGNEFAFDTGVLRGVLRGGGQSKGLLPVFDCASGMPLAKSLGWFSHYRLLDDATRYGKAAWDWPSVARVIAGGAVEVNWKADEAHPFDMQAEYRWAAPNTLDLATRVTARKELKKFEVFLASYFDGFAETRVYAGPSSGWTSPTQADGKWHAFPRDEQAVSMLQDGRWKRGANPVEWSIRPRLNAPLAVRRDAERGLTAVLMTRAADCFAVAAPHDGEGHRSLYVSLFGRDLAVGQSIEARSRLMIVGQVTQAEAVGHYESFCREAGKT